MGWLTGHLPIKKNLKFPHLEIEIVKEKLHRIWKNYKNKYKSSNFLLSFSWEMKWANYIRCAYFHLDTWLFFFPGGSWQTKTQWKMLLVIMAVRMRKKKIIKGCGQLRRLKRDLQNLQQLWVEDKFENPITQLVDLWKGEFHFEMFS